MDVQKLYARLKQEGRVHEHPEFGYQLSDAMLNRIHVMLHRAMKIAEQEHLISKNPTEGVAVPKPNYRPKQILNDKQLDKFMEAIQRDEVWRDFFYTELTIGLRCGELCGLKWEDFDEEAGTLKIQRTVHAKRNGVLNVGEPKTGKGNRKIVLPATTAAMLRERKKTALTVWIFPQPLRPEEPTNPHSAYYHMKAILKKEGLPSIRFHDLRHPYVKPATKNFLKNQETQTAKVFDGLGFPIFIYCLFFIYCLSIYEAHDRHRLCLRKSMTLQFFFNQHCLILRT